VDVRLLPAFVPDDIANVAESDTDAAPEQTRANP
jgi:hypothetical protein